MKSLWIMDARDMKTMKIEAIFVYQDFFDNLSSEFG